jgi:hypothetical protein
MKPLLLLLSLIGSAHAQTWRLESSSKAAPVGHGAVSVVKQVIGPAKAEIRLVVFDETQCQMRVVANAESKSARTLDAIGLTENALAVCNGGYFHAGGDFGPSGLEIAKEVRSDKLTGGQWLQRRDQLVHLHTPILARKSEQMAEIDERFQKERLWNESLFSPLFFSFANFFFQHLTLRA